MSMQYHILVTGFELEKRNKNGDVSKSTLRHYRYPQDGFKVVNENGSYCVYPTGDKQWIAMFPVSHSMILLEKEKTVED